MIVRFGCLLKPDICCSNPHPKRIAPGRDLVFGSCHNGRKAAFASVDSIDRAIASFDFAYSQLVLLFEASRPEVCKTQPHVGWRNQELSWMRATIAVNGC